VIPAAICVNVVVDDGRSAVTRHCTNAAYGDTAAEVLAERAREVHRPAPRYNGNFLCAIDGYPGTGCGDHGTEPYWSFWIWANGRWSYSSFGVDSYPVSDSDHDGKPDPIGFRYQPFKTKQSPRAGGFAAPPPTHPPTTQPPRPAPSPVPSRAPVPSPGGTGGAGASGPTASSARPTAMRRPTPAGASESAAPPSDGPSADAVEPTPEAAPHRGNPAGAIAVGALALALIGAAVWRSRTRGGASP
jgi:hypothetical protein